MQHENSFEYFINDFNHLLVLLEKNKKTRSILIALTIISGLIWFYQGSPIVFDAFNAVTITIIVLLIGNIISFVSNEIKSEVIFKEKYNNNESLENIIEKYSPQLTNINNKDINSVNPHYGK